MRDATPRAVSAAADPPNLGVLLLEATACHHGPALTLAGSGDGLSYPELGQALREIAGGLMTLGVEPGDRVSIIGHTRPEWTLGDLGALCAGAAVVPIYQTIAPEECECVLAHAGSRVILCEDGAQVAKIDAVRANCPALEHVVALCGEAPGALTLRELRERGAALTPELVDARATLAGPQDIATLVYTSGTTGPPKGCMLTHGNVLATMRTSEQRLGLREETPSIFLLPPARARAGTAHAARGDRRRRNARAPEPRFQSPARGPRRRTSIARPRAAARSTRRSARRPGPGRG